ncbi:MAG: very short patch repair endonuclease [Flavobacteriales bacterium]|nr:very short patch repair endonuclease [Flavobacteriales bacterium]
MADRKYVRDGRAPIPKDARTSALMSRIRSRNTGPELALRKALHVHGVRGYRLHYRGVPGRPDLAFVGKRVAVFVHGCFWHGCPWCSPKRPRSNSAFWNAKLDRNKARDAEQVQAVKNVGWRVVTIWACQLEKASARQVARIQRACTGR